MRDVPPPAFAVRDPVSAALEVRVNFGLVAGRQATPAEIDELARLLVPEVGELSIVAEERHEIGAGSEAIVQQVRIELGRAQLPDDEGELERLSGRLVAAASAWASACAEERRVD